ncbi:hepatic lectin-like [Stegastes partitus]|uniref:Hepatic lectin-like n=1 Tax=Stegastes partitus TaxID=144197 RepID=A0A3B5ACK0_9TELE|nr:PREDICTED: hepatic lectin-like [Stegastes partitus]
MSMAMMYKLEDAEGDTWSTMTPDKRSQYGLRSHSRVWWIRAAAVGLGLLLLILIFGLVAHNASSIGQRKLLLDHMVQREKLIQNLTTDNNALRDELKLMKINSSRLTKEMEVLQSQYNTTAASRDNLQQEVNRLNATTCKVCQQGWVKFNNKCYYASKKGQNKNWEDSRVDCLRKGASLVMPTTRAELDFVVTLYSRTWIGLSDKKKEGTWHWVDGTELQTAFWQTGEPNNDDSNEDCAEISRTTGEWNDVSCNTRIPWICED